MSESITPDLIHFLSNSPTPYHAVQNLRTILINAGFKELSEDAPWDNIDQPSFTTRNGSSLIAFKPGTQNPAEVGWRMLGAHTDSPCLKLKPNANQSSKNIAQWGVETYGGVLLRSWFDRDLGLAGRVSVNTTDGNTKALLYDSKRPVATIPNLAIHLHSATHMKELNSQNELPPVIAFGGEDEEFDLYTWLESELKDELSAFSEPTIVSHELSLYDTQAPQLVGLNKQWLCSARLDNLLSTFVGCHALIHSDTDFPSLYVTNDHEEVGSQSTSGAQGTFLKDVLTRLHHSNAEDIIQAIQRSLMISLDNAHAVHPNYVTRHDPDHLAPMGGGLVIKCNANQRYATNSQTAGIIKRLGTKHNRPVQSFVVRADMACGSTIGPITSGNIGIPTVDCGIPQWAMHSIRETASCEDINNSAALIKAFFEEPCVKTT